MRTIAASMDAKSGAELAKQFTRVDHVVLDVVADPKAMSDLVAAHDITVRLAEHTDMVVTC